MIRERLGKELLYFDGGMGTLLQAKGLQPGELPETWNVTHADEIKNIHKQYISAGIDIVLANTFGANALKFHCDDFPLEEYDYIVDAVDTVTAKIELIMKAKEKNVPIMSSMGAGNKLDASRFQVADIYKTKVCPLAKVMRRELKKRRVKKLKVVYSDELPTRPIEDMSISCRTNCICPPGAKHKCTERRDIPGSVAFVPSVAGLIIAGEVVKDLCTI